MTVTEKLCRTCGETKPATGFYKHPATKDGLQYRCKSCAAAYERNRRGPRKIAPSKHIMLSKDVENKTGVCAFCGPVEIVMTHKGWRCKYRRQFTKSGNGKPCMGYRSGVCPICSKYSKKLVYDHDHGDGAFRGWICFSCNRALGIFGDSPKVLMKAANYLKTHVRLKSENAVLQNDVLLDLGQTGGPVCGRAVGDRQRLMQYHTIK